LQSHRVRRGPHRGGDRAASVDQSSRRSPVRRRRARAARRPRRRCSASAIRLAISSWAMRWGSWVKGAPQV